MGSVWLNGPPIYSINPSISFLLFCPAVGLSLCCFPIFLQIPLDAVCLPLASGKEGVGRVPFEV